MPYKRSYRTNGRGRGRAKRGYKKKTGLNKTEKKQVKAIISKKAESKFFKTSIIGSPQGLQLQTNVADESHIECHAFIAGVSNIEGVANTYGYASAGGVASSITPLNVFRTFQSTTVNVDGSVSIGDSQKYEVFVPEGRKASPSFSQTQMRIFRDCVNTNSDDKAEMAVPYYYRVIRVIPKKQKFTDVELDPQTDLFLDNFGEAYGIYSAGDTYRPAFQRFELMTSKINRRRYQVLDDLKFQLLPPTSTSNGFDDFDGRLVSTINSNGAKLITFNHKRPKVLYYDGNYQEQSGTQPLTNNSQEMIFVHCCMLGTDSPNINLQTKIDVKVVSMFKDI
jgi:hypothetical protein